MVLEIISYWLLCHTLPWAQHLKTASIYRCRVSGSGGWLWPLCGCGSQSLLRARSATGRDTVIRRRGRRGCPSQLTHMAAYGLSPWFTGLIIDRLNVPTTWRLACHSFPSVTSQHDSGLPSSTSDSRETQTMHPKRSHSLYPQGYHPLTSNIFYSLIPHSREGN